MNLNSKPLDLSGAKVAARMCGKERSDWQTNVPWTGSVFTDTTHSAENQGFYKIDVRLRP